MWPTLTDLGPMSLGAEQNSRVWSLSSGGPPAPGRPGSVLRFERGVLTGDTEKWISVHALVSWQNWSTPGKHESRPRGRLGHKSGHRARHPPTAPRPGFIAVLEPSPRAAR